MQLQLNKIKPAKGSNSVNRRVGRGIGSGWGKTSGRGHKGQKSRAGGFHKIGFEGGQMPMHKRLPKRGFTANRKIGANRSVLIRLSDLAKIEENEIDILILKKFKLLKQAENRVKVVATGKLEKAINIKNLYTSKNAKEIIEKAGGSVSFSETTNTDRKLPKKEN